MSVKSIKKEVKPFLKEWKELSNGIYRDVHVGTYKFKVFFFWREDNISNYEIHGIYSDDPFLMEKVIPNSKAYKDFDKRIQRFINRTMDYGEKNHKDKDYLWENYFWKHEF